jgi:hypothetical protein
MRELRHPACSAAAPLSGLSCGVIVTADVLFQSIQPEDFKSSAELKSLSTGSRRPPFSSCG